MSDKELEIFADSESLPASIEELQAGDASHVFTDSAMLMKYYDEVERIVKSEVVDGNTAEGRKRAKALSRKVSSCKTLIEKPARDYLKKIKAQVKPVESNTKAFVDAMNALRDEVAKPATDYEAEQARIEAEKQAVFDGLQAIVDKIDEALPTMADALKIEQISSAIVATQAVDLAPSGDRLSEAEKLQAKCLQSLEGTLAIEKNKALERAQQEEKRIEQIKADATKKAREDQEAAIRQAELDRQAAEQLAQTERENADKRAEAAAIEATRKAEQEARMREELAKTEAADREAEAKRKSEDKEYRRGVHTEILQKIVALGVDTDIAKDIIVLAATGGLGKLTVNY